MSTAPRNKYWPIDLVPDVIDPKTNQPLQPVDHVKIVFGNTIETPQVSFWGDWGFYTDNQNWCRPFRDDSSLVEYADDPETGAAVLVSDRRSYKQQFEDEQAFDALLRGTPRSANTNNGFAKARVPGKRFDYMLEPLKQYDGWFPRGRTHIIAGSSGAGKTRLMLDLLTTQQKHQYFLGHRGAGLEFIVVFADRGQLANEETLITMGLEHIKDRIKHIPVVWGEQAADAIKQLVESLPEMPGIVFIEGGDMLVEKPNAMESVAPFMSKLNELAAYYHLAIVVSLGSGKHKEGEGYKNARDRAYGSVAWTRMSDMMLQLSQDGDDDSDDRVLIVKHRAERGEKFELRFVDGHLRQKPKLPDNMHPVDEFFARQPDKEFTRGQIVEGMKDAEADLNKSAVYNRVNKLFDEGKLARRTREEDGKHVFRWMKQN